MVGFYFILQPVQRGKCSVQKMSGIFLYIGSWRFMLFYNKKQLAISVPIFVFPLLLFYYSLNFLPAFMGMFPPIKINTTLMKHKSLNKTNHSSIDG